MSDKWLKPQRESDEQKAERRRRAKESPPSPQHTVRQLNALRSEPNPPPAGSSLPKQQRIDPKAIIEGEEPQPVSKTPDPPILAALGSAPPAVAAAPAIRSDPDPRLVEIARTWSWLTEHDREELLLLVRVKAHLNQQAAGK